MDGLEDLHDKGGSKHVTLGCSVILGVCMLD